MTKINFITCECIVVFDKDLKVLEYKKKCDIHKDLPDQDAFNAALALSASNQVKTFTPVRPMYMRLALLQMGMLSTIESALENPALAVQKIAWEYALEFKRDDAMINGFATQMGLTTEQVDALFDLGAQLQSQA